MLLSLSACGDNAGQGVDAGATDTDAGPSADAAPPPANPYEFWIGDVGPSEGTLALGPQQQPFLCTTHQAGLGQPLIDNQDGIGHGVFSETVPGMPDYGTEPLGYSQNCSIETRVDYFYRDRQSRRFQYFDPSNDFDNPPETIDVVLVDGVTVPFVVRVETGTLNRFVYTIAMLAPWPESTATPAELNNAAWNQKAIYWMRGGVGIGHNQGDPHWHYNADLGQNNGLWSAERDLFPTLLGRGYAIVTSTGNTSDVQYNIKLHEENAFMVKEHFVATYGAPTYTFGLGGSGGAIQQYIIGQNHPGIFDAGIPLYAYPDMITQAIDISDCDLLMQYFVDDITLDGPTSPWYTWSNQSLLLGLNAVDTPGLINSWHDDIGLPFLPFAPDGSNECLEGWQAATPVVLNPATAPDPFIAEDYLQAGFSQEDIDAVRWTHLDDLGNIYGTLEHGFAPTLQDNIGVQYGLGSLVDGAISTTEFLDVNSCIGSWKSQPDMVEWALWDLLRGLGGALDVFDSLNSTRDPDPTLCRDPVNFQPNLRIPGDVEAWTQAYTSGHVFIGNLDMPVIDLRPYLEPELDMHNAKQAFSARTRMDAYKGDHANQVIWFTGSEDAVGPHILEGLDLLERYLIEGAPPIDWTDRCYDADGAIIAAGPGVYDGILDDNSPGPCTSQYPPYASSRMVAGDSVSGDMFKCALKPVADALSDGTYGDVTFTVEELDRLNAIFPDGVCDYSQPDQGRPAGL